jgi:hypothetical protein
MRGTMPYDPSALWDPRPPACQAHLCAASAALFQEGSDGQRRGHAPRASPTPSAPLEAPVHPAPALRPQASLRLQDALTARARDGGWAAEGREGRETAVGPRARRTRQREGFNACVGQVTLGQGGLLLSDAVTRLSRPCSDGDPRCDLGGDHGGWRADSAGGAAPAPAHGRGLRGFTGPLAAGARHPIRARMTAGLLPQAARGARAVPHFLMKQQK